jgi:hypothetical protein
MIYVASKTQHAEMWRLLREHMHIHASWIDEAGEGQTASYAELSVRCLEEIKQAAAFVLYCNPDDLLKGALIEVGAALAFGIPVYCVGDCSSLSRVFKQHPLWHTCPSLHEACELIAPEGGGRK